jgi:hypothetical protein
MMLQQVTFHVAAILLLLAEAKEVSERHICVKANVRSIGEKKGFNG